MRLNQSVEINREIRDDDKVEALAKNSCFDIACGDLLLGRNFLNEDLISELDA